MPTATDFKMKEGEFSKNVSLGIIYFYIANSKFRFWYIG